MPCPVLQTSHVLGKKWTVPIMTEVALGGFDGFNNFARRVPLTPRILSKQLKELETAGLIKRLEAARTRYELTEKCLETPCTRCDSLGDQDVSS